MVSHARYLVLLAIGAALFSMGAATCHAAPKVQVGQTVYDAGSVPEGKEIAHEFILRNDGDKTLSFKIKPC